MGTPCRRPSRDDLAVEVVGLDAAGAAPQALPRGAAAAFAPGDRRDPQDVAAALAVLGVADHRDAGGGQRRLALGTRAVAQAVGVRPGRAAGLDGVAEVHHQLAVLPGHHVGARARRRTRRRGTPRRRPRSVASAPPGKRPTSRMPGHRAAVLLDHTGLEVAGRHHHADALHVVEEAQQRRLVGHAVLHRDDRRRGGQRGDQVLDRRLRLVALHREQHGDRAAPSAARAASAAAGTSIVRVPSGVARRQPVAPYGVEVRAAGHQHARPRPASWSSPPSTPPTAPAPYTIHRMRPACHLSTKVDIPGVST